MLLELGKRHKIVKAHQPLNILGYKSMRTIKFTSWQEDDFFIGYLNDYPDYLTQGMSKEELAENLKSLLVDLESGEVPYIRRVEELMVA